MTRLEKHYQETVVPQLMERFGYKNVMQVPRLTKITLNMGVGEAVGNKKILENAAAEMGKIAGQKAIITLSKKFLKIHHLSSLFNSSIISVK